MDLKCRKLTIEDGPGYRDLRLRSLREYPKAFGASYESEAQKDKLYFETMIEQELPDKFMTGAFLNDHLIGICGFIREEQQKSNHRGIIIQMYIRPEYQGQKVGKQLLTEVLNVAFKLAGLEIITLGVISNNLPAVHLYQNTGFTEYGYLKNYYKDDDHYYDHTFFSILREQIAENE